MGADVEVCWEKFARPGAQVIAQYDNFLRFGFEGCQRVPCYSRDVAASLAGRIAELGASPCSPTAGNCRTSRSPSPRASAATRSSTSPRPARAPLVRAPPAPSRAHREDLAVMRIAVRNGFTHDLADLLIADLERVLPRLHNQLLHSGAISRVSPTAPTPPLTTGRPATPGPAMIVGGRCGLLLGVASGDLARPRLCHQARGNPAP